MFNGLCKYFEDKNALDQHYRKNPSHRSINFAVCKAEAFRRMKLRNSSYHNRIRNYPENEDIIKKNSCMPQEPCGHCDKCFRPESASRKRPPSPTEPHPDESSGYRRYSRRRESSSSDSSSSSSSRSKRYSSRSSSTSSDSDRPRKKPRVSPDKPVVAPEPPRIEQKEPLIKPLVQPNIPSPPKQETSEHVMKPLVPNEIPIPSKQIVLEPASKPINEPEKQIKPESPPQLIVKPVVKPPFVSSLNPIENPKIENQNYTLGSKDPKQGGIQLKRPVIIPRLFPRNPNLPIRQPATKPLMPRLMGRSSSLEPVDLIEKKVRKPSTSSNLLAKLNLSMPKPDFLRSPTESSNNNVPSSPSSNPRDPRKRKPSLGGNTTPTSTFNSPVTPPVISNTPTSKDPLKIARAASVPNASSKISLNFYMKHIKSKTVMDENNLPNLPSPNDLFNTKNESKLIESDREIPAEKSLSDSIQKEEVAPVLSNAKVLPWSSKVSEDVASYVNTETIKETVTNEKEEVQDELEQFLSKKSSKVSSWTRKSSSQDLNKSKNVETQIYVESKVIQDDNDKGGKQVKEFTNESKPVNEVTEKEPNITKELTSEEQILDKPENKELKNEDHVQKEINESILNNEETMETPVADDRSKELSVNEISNEDEPTEIFSDQDQLIENLTNENKLVETVTVGNELTEILDDKPEHVKVSAKEELSSEVVSFDETITNNTLDPPTENDQFENDSCGKNLDEEIMSTTEYVTFIVEPVDFSEDSYDEADEKIVKDKLQGIISSIMVSEEESNLEETEVIVQSEGYETCTQDCDSDITPFNDDSSVTLDDNVFIEDPNMEDPTSMANVEVKSTSPIDEDTVVLIYHVDKSIDYCPKCQSKLCPFEGGYTLNVVTYDVSLVCIHCSKKVIIKELFTDRQKDIVWSSNTV